MVPAARTSARAWPLVALVVAASCGRDPLLTPLRDASVADLGGRGGSGGARPDGGGQGGGGADAPRDARLEAGTDVVPGSVTLTLLPGSAPPLPVGQSLQWRAQVVLGGSPRDVTTEPGLSWSVEDAQVLQVTERGGRVTGLRPGRSVLRAVHAVLGLATTTVTVTAAPVARLEMQPALLDLDRGQSKQLVVRAVYADGVDVNATGAAEWRTEDQRIARVGTGLELPGLVTGVAGGSTTVSARFAGNEASAAVAVAQAPGDLMLTISPGSLSRAVGSTARFMASARLTSGALADVTAQAAWSSGSAQVASSLGSGQFRCLSAASTMVSARLMGVTAMATLQCGVGPAPIKELWLSRANSPLPVGSPYQVFVEAVPEDGSTPTRLNGSQVTWSNSDPTVASIDRMGVLTGLRPGTVTIGASFSGASGQESYSFVAR